MISILCTYDIDPNAPDSSGTSPLYFVALRSRPELVAALLDGGACPNLFSCLETPLHASVRIGDLPTTMLLLASGAFANARGNSDIVLQSAYV